MRTPTKILLAAILFTSAAAHARDCPKPGTQDLVGLWETRDTSQGGIGHTVEFRPDGSYVEATTVIVNAVYRISGDRLIVRESASDLEEDEAAQGFRFEIQGDKLLQMYPGKTIEKKRLGKAEEGVPAIVGTWRHRHYTGATAFERFTPDGRLFLRLPMTSSAGCYKIAGDRIAFEGPRHKKKDVTFEASSGELVFKDSRKSAAVYTRDEAGPWYDREKN